MAAAIAVHKKLAQNIVERSTALQLPRLPVNYYEITIRHKNRLALPKVLATRLSAAVRIAELIPRIKGQQKDVLVVNDMQGTLIISTPDMDTL